MSTGSLAPRPLPFLARVQVARVALVSLARPSRAQHWSGKNTGKNHGQNYIVLNLSFSSFFQCCDWLLPLLASYSWSHSHNLIAPNYHININSCVNQSYQTITHTVKRIFLLITTHWKQWIIHTEYDEYKVRLVLSRVSSLIDYRSFFC